MNPVELRRRDPARNMCRFYRLAIEPDLFGGFRLLREWGSIGGFLVFTGMGPATAVPPAIS